MGDVKRISKCYFCDEEFNKISCLKHLDKCEKRHKYYETKENKKNYFTIKIEGDKDYYLYVDISKKAKLEELDFFLRNIWLECCGHMSVFNIYGDNYSSYPDSDFDDSDMNFQVGKILKVGDVFSYEYDFGSTTELKLSVISEFSGKEKEKIELAIRNIKPIYTCSCGEAATNICGYCYDVVCEKCISNHSCGDEAMLDIVNSPRTGVCAYEDETSEDYKH